MASASALHLYEEVLLLALRDKEGTVANSQADCAVAAALLAELMLDQRIAVEPTRKKLIDVLNSTPTGDPLLDECLEQIRSSRRRASLSTWVSRFLGIRRLRHRAALQLCHRGILRADERKLLLIFTQKIFPEINPLPERKIIERLHTAVFSDTGTVESRTAALVSLASATDLLTTVFGRKPVRQRKQRIKAITSGDAIGEATREVIETVQMVVMTATAMAAVAASSG